MEERFGDGWGARVDDATPPRRLESPYRLTLRRMPSHLSSIGFPGATMDELQPALEAAASAAEEIPAPRGAYLRWSSPAGAEVWIQVDRKRQVVGFTPYFAGRARMEASVTERITSSDHSALDGAYHAWAEPDDERSGEGLFPFVFDVPDDALVRSTHLPARKAIALSAFAHELRVFPSEAAFDASQDAEPRFASRSFIPTGLFRSDDSTGPEPYAVFTGHIMETAILSNPLTGSVYLWALTDTLGGSIDVVADRDLLSTQPVAGGILTGSFWLCGRFAPTPAPEGRLRRAMRLLKGPS